MVLWWIGNAILLLVVLPVVIFLLNRVLAALPWVDARCEGTFFVWLRLPEGSTCERLLDEAA